MDLSAVERQCIIRGLLKEEKARFETLARIANDLVDWENKAAHIKEAEDIKHMADEIISLATRRQQLENEQTKHA